MVTTALTLLKSTLFRYQGHIGAALVLGGSDNKGPHLFTVYPHGSSDALPYAAMGSGSLAAMATLESRFTEHMNLEDAKNLAASAIHAGIMNDLGSGSCVDLCVITGTTAQYLRNYSCDVSRTFHSKVRYEFSSDNTCTNTSNVSNATRT
jgi:20S proteasome subunit beta 2